MLKSMEYWIIAAYHLTPIADPAAVVEDHKKFFSCRDVACRIYVSREGLNIQMSARADHGAEYQEWLKGLFGEVVFKVHQGKEHVFPRVTVKVRKQLVALDWAVDLANRGEAVSSAEWREMLEEQDADTVVIDTRNEYEWQVGHFEGAELPKCGSFREFPEYTRELKEVRDPKKTRVLMYCTGGIRCEYYSALMKEEGFEEVYHLKGGVIQYGLEEGDKGWKGKLFVFDDRLVVPLAGEAAPIAECTLCLVPCDRYVNCANVDCNELFVVCGSCFEKEQGCCSAECRGAPRVRAPSEKPFRRLSCCVTA